MSARDSEVQSTSLPQDGDVYAFYHSDGSEYTWDNATGAGVFTYYHQIGGRTVAFTTSDDSKTTWMFSDQISSTSLTRDDAGVNRVQRYTPWGETRTDGGLETDHTYTGQIEDTTTGLRFYNARYMDPVLGRFVSPDTIVPNPSNGQDYNRYTYVLNNPIPYNDPSGHCSDYVPCEGDGPTTTDESPTGTSYIPYSGSPGGDGGGAFLGEPQDQINFLSGLLQGILQETYDDIAPHIGNGRIYVDYDTSQAETGEFVGAVLAIPAETASDVLAVGSAIVHIGQGEYGTASVVVGEAVVPRAGQIAFQRLKYGDRLLAPAKDQVDYVSRRLARVVEAEAEDVRRGIGVVTSFVDSFFG